MPNTDVTTPAQVLPPNRFGRSGVIVFFVTLVTAAAFGGVAYLMRNETASKDVLVPLMYIIGSVGLAWSLVLAVRAVANRESLIFPFFILLPIFWALCIPLLQTWPDRNRGVDDKWYFLHVGLFPLTIPLGVLALTVAAPVIVWLRHKTNQSEESERPQLRRRARKVFLIVASAVFVVLFPFGLFLFAGTMMHDRQWTAPVVEAMPRWIGNADYALLRSFPNKYTDRMADDLFERGLLTIGRMQEEIEANATKKDASDAFFALKRLAPIEAMDSARKLVNNPSTTKNDGIAKYFAHRCSADELRSLLKLERFELLSDDIKVGVIFGLENRLDKLEFKKDVDVLVSGRTLTASMALGFIAGNSSDEDTISIYSKLIQQNDPNLDRFTKMLLSYKRGAVLDAGLRQSEPPKRHSVLKGILLRALATGTDSKFQNISECRNAFRQMIDSEDRLERALTALIVLVSVERPSQHMQTTFNISLRPPGVKTTQAELLRAPLETQTIVQRAREILLRW